MTASPINPNQQPPPHRKSRRRDAHPPRGLPLSSASPKAPCATGATSAAGPRSFKIGRHVRYWRTDLILWLTEQTNRPQDQR